MTDSDGNSPRIPVLVSAGQVVRREAGTESPMALAAAAAQTALTRAGGGELAQAIDTISVTRLFSESGAFFENRFGGSDNPPMSIATAIGANPRDCVYGQVGGNEPISRLIEFARDIARGEREVVLLAGAEATLNQRNAERHGTDLDWAEQHDRDLDDRGWGEPFAGRQEVATGMVDPVFYLGMIEQSRAHVAGLDYLRYRESLAPVLAANSVAAAANPYAQYPQAFTPGEILGAAPLNQMYSERMVGRFEVNLGAALLLMSSGRADELGVPARGRVYLHGLAEADEVILSQRPQPWRSPLMERVLSRVLDQAALEPERIELFDLHGNYPCVTGFAADHLGLPADGSVSLSLCGAPQYFGDPGNNYAMHGLAEAVERLGSGRAASALVAGMGGTLNKYAASLLATAPSDRDWADTDSWAGPDGLARHPLVTDPAEAFIVSYVVNFHRGQASQAMALLETRLRERCVAVTAFGDSFTVASMISGSRVGRPVRVSQGSEPGQLHFTLRP